MRIYPFASRLFIFFIALWSGGCSKESDDTDNGSKPNTAPVCFAGNDTEIWLPLDSVQLAGATVDAESNIRSVRWTRLAGPGSVQIITGESLSTQVRGLTEGRHEFELAVTDAGGLSDRDTLEVQVNRVIALPGERIFTNLSWKVDGLSGPLLWGSCIIIRNIYSYLPPGVFIFDAYIRRDNAPVWDWLDPFNPPTSVYEYQLVDDHLLIFAGTRETDTPDIKLVF